MYLKKKKVFFLRARYDHNKIAPCGMFKVSELNWIEASVHRPQLSKRKESLSVFEPRSLCLPA